MKIDKGLHQSVMKHQVETLVDTALHVNMMFRGIGERSGGNEALGMKEAGDNHFEKLSYLLDEIDLKDPELSLIHH